MFSSGHFLQFGKKPKANEKKKLFFLNLFFVFLFFEDTVNDEKSNFVFIKQKVP